LNNVATWVLAIGWAVIGACAEVQVIAPEGEQTGGSDPMATDTGNHPDSDTERDTTTGTEEDSAWDTEPGSDTNTEFDTIAETDSDSHSDTDTGSGSASDTDSESDTISGPDTDTDTDTEIGTNTEPSFSIFINFRENIQFFPYYSSHRLLAGRATSQSPEDGSWILIANGSTMKNSAANDSWSTVSIEATTQISALGQGSIRLAFHYQGTSADDWWLDDICVGKSESSCELFGPEDFSGTFAGNLPSGWFDVEGIDDESSSHDWSVDLPTFDSQRAVGITFDNAQVSRYLTTPPILLH